MLSYCNFGSNISKFFGWIHVFVGFFCTKSINIALSSLFHLLGPRLAIAGLLQYLSNIIKGRRDKEIISNSGRKASSSRKRGWTDEIKPQHWQIGANQTAKSPRRNRVTSETCTIRLFLFVCGKFNKGQFRRGKVSARHFVPHRAETTSFSASGNLEGKKWNAENAHRPPTFGFNQAIKLTKRWKILTCQAKSFLYVSLSQNLHPFWSKL